MIELNQRQNEILKIIVATHIKTGRPVGSETIAARDQNELSPATIRNVMHLLEELGFIFQPHPSAGRVPTDLGYRYYVDHLMEESEVRPHVVAMVAREYRSPKESIEALVERTCRLLSELAAQASFVFFPNLDTLTLNRVELVRLGPKHLLLVWVAGNGFVQTCAVEMPGEIPPEEDLQRISQLLNREVSGMRFDEICPYLDRKVGAASDVSHALYRSAREIASRGFPETREQKLLIEGSHYVLEQPEFRVREKTHLLFKALEDRDPFRDLLRGDLTSAGVQVRIGFEHRCGDMQDCSFVSTRYQVDERSVGGLGVWGPRRMPYGEMVALVDYVARRFGEVLERW